MSLAGSYRPALLLLAALAVTAASAFSPARAEGEEPPAAASWSGNVNLFAGAKILDGDEWEPVDRQAEGGVLIDFRHRVLPFNIAIDLLYSRDEEDIDVEVLNVGRVTAKVESEIMEFDLGLRKIWEQPKVLRPFLGGGLAIIRAEIEASARGRSTSDTDTAVGAWLDAGIYVTLAERWNVGVDGRWSWAQLDLAGVDDGNGKGWHIGALVGVHW